jgi:hypothetical protein
MRRLSAAIVTLILGAATLAADQTWSGKISDSMCGAKHDPTAQHGKQVPDRDCALACKKEHNAQFVFVSDGKVYNVSNQDFAALREHAGHTVQLTGTVAGDTITVAKIAMAGK